MLPAALLGRALRRANDESAVLRTTSWAAA